MNASPVSPVRIELVLLLALWGCSPFPAPEPVPPPAPPASYSESTTCVVDLAAPRGLRTVTTYTQPGRGGLFLMEGSRYRPLERRYPSTREGGYAGAEDWFQKGEVIRQYGRRYVKYGLVRRVPPDALTLGAAHKGIPVFLDRNDQQRPAVLYVPVAPGCIFQPYAWDAYRAGT